MRVYQSRNHEEDSVNMKHVKQSITYMTMYFLTLLVAEKLKLIQVWIRLSRKALTMLEDLRC